MNEIPTQHPSTNELAEHAMRQACDQESQRAPLPDEILPEIEPQQSWSCTEGCGACEPQEIDFEYFRATDLTTGAIQESRTHKAFVSHCCHADLELWDESIEDFVPFSLSGPDGPKSLKG